MLSLSRRGLLLSFALAPPSALCLWYGQLASNRQKTLVGEICSALPDIIGGGTVRFARSLKTGILISFDYKWNKDDLSAVHSRAAQRILDGCLRNGGLYIKFGQGLVSMNHVLPREYLDTLRVLQDQCPIRLNETEVEEIIREDLGRPPAELFSEFESRPVAAASLAQVFRAKTLDGSRTVAVKVQYRELREQFASDVGTLTTILNIVELMHPKFAFAWILTELRDAMEQELDFEQEGRNSERCGRDLAHLPFVHVPEVLWELCSKRVLTTEFIDGLRINRTSELTKANFDLADIDRKLVRAFAEQIFRTGFVHADPHPGNLLVRRMKDGKAEIVILDHGLYERIPSKVRISLCRVWRAVVEGDHTAMREGCEQLGVTDDHRIFCMALTQRYVAPAAGDEQADILTRFLEKNGPKTFSHRKFRQLPEGEQEKLLSAISDFQDRVLTVFQRVPSQLVLVFRNLNIIRSIIREHGTGVDRYRIMARVAASGAYFHEGSGWLDCVRGHWFSMLFDLRLLVDAAKMYVMGLGWQLFSYLGYMPVIKDTKNVMHLTA